MSKLLGEFIEDFKAGDGGLVVEDLVAIFIADSLGFGIEVAGVDGGLEAPCVEGKWEVMTDPGDVIFGGGFEEEGIGAGAVGALEIFKLDDGDAGTGGGFQGCRIVDQGSSGRGCKLGDGSGGGKHESGDGEEVVSA